MKKIIKKIGAVICTFALAITSAGAVIYAAEPDYGNYYALMRRRWEATLTGGDGYNRNDPVIAKKINRISETAMEYLNSMTDKSTWNENGEKGYIWADADPMTLSSFEQYAGVNNMYNRVKEMALAYRIGNDGVMGNEKLKAAVFDALEWLYEKWYNPSVTQYGNWYQWQLGIPLSVNDTLILMYDELSDGLLEKYMSAIDAFPPQKGHVLVGANQIWYCTVLAVRGALGGNYEKIEKAKSGIQSVMPYVTSGDGFYSDGSFVQHNMYAYNGGYGSSLMRNLTPVLQMLADTPWQPESGSISNIYKWIYDSFEPLFYKGAFMDMVRGREISRQNTSSYVTGRYIIEAIVRVIQFAPEADAEYYKSLVKYMVEESAPAYDFYENTTIQLYLLTKSVIEDASVSARGKYELFKMYSAMDRVVQHNGNYSVGLSMHSNRIAAFEKINGENIKGWYTGSGMLYLYNNDLTQFTGDYWCTVDARRLPGTTVLRGVSDLPAEVGSVNARGQNSWTGGTGILGLYGTAGMQLQPVNQTLNAKKSYFMFDNEIVCLGADISAKDGEEVETTVENLKLNANGDNKFIVNGTEKSSAAGYDEKLDNVKWAFISGNTEKSDVGYYFPDSTAVNVLREKRDGNWSQMNQSATQKDDTPKSDNYLTMYIDHGKKPQNGEYSYVILPGKNSEGTKAYSENPDITVLANNGDVQAARDDVLGVAGANFWNNKETTVYETVNGVKKEYITANSKASVMVAEQNGKIDISVSDPTQENDGRIFLEVNRSASRVISKDARISVINTSPSIVLAVDVSSSKGQSAAITLEAGTTEITEKLPEINSDGKIILRGNGEASVMLDTSGTRPVRFTLGVNAPNGISIDRFGVLKADECLDIGTYMFDVTAENKYGKSTKAFTLLKRNSTPAAYWSFDEGSGTVFGDTVNTNRKTELANNPVWSDGGKNGSCMEFPAPTGTAAAPVAVVQTTNDLNFINGIEIELDVQFYESPVSGRTHLLLEKRAVGGYVPYALRVSSDGRIGLRWNNIWYESEALDWNTNEWYSIYARYDGQKVVFERNYTYCGAVPNTEKASSVNSYFAIGAGRTDSKDYFVGKIDNVILSSPNEKGGLAITSADAFTYTPGAAGGFNVTVNESEKPVNFALYGAPDGVHIDSNGYLTVDDNLAENTYTFYIAASYTDKLDAVQAFILTVGAPVPENSTDKAVIHWSFNEGAGDTAKTKSSPTFVSDKVDFNAKLGGGASWTEGFVGSGVHFGAKSDILSVIDTKNYQTPIGIGMDPNSANNKFGGGVEYDFWVNFDTDPRMLKYGQIIISRKNNGGKIPYAIKVTQEGKLAYCWSNEWIEGEPLDWNVGEWYHINVTRLKDGTVTLKRDGTVVGTGKNTLAFTASGGGVVVNDSDKITTSSKNYFTGTLDEFFMGALGGGSEIVLRSKVSFNTNGAGTVSPQYIWLDEKASAPAVPEKSGCVFTGWYTDAECTQRYDFSSPVTNDVTLYAGWNEETFASGDANKDGAVNIADMVALKKMTADNKYDIIGDINRDGRLDASDIAELRKIILKQT